MPIVDEKTARKQAADRIYALRKNSRHREESQAIQEKHGSRKSGLPPTSQKARRKAEPKQTEFPF
jgi:deoxyribodipyrimidine photo-lyase